MTFSCCRAASKAVRHLSYSLVPGRSPSVRHFWSSGSAVSCREAQPANTKPTAIISATLIGTPCSAVSASLSRHDEVSTSRGIIGYNESHMRLQCAPKAAVCGAEADCDSLAKTRELAGPLSTAPSISVHGMCAGRILDALQDIPSQRQPVAQMRKSPPHRRLSEDTRDRTSTGTRESTRMTRNRPRPVPRMGAKFRKSATLGLTAVQ